VTLSEIEAEARKCVDAKWLDSPTYDLSSLAVQALSGEGRLVGAHQAEELGRLEALAPEQAAELVVLRAGTGSCEVLREMHAAAERENVRLRARVDEVERAYVFDTAALKKRVDELVAQRDDLLVETAATPAIRRLAPSAATQRVQDDMRRAAAELDSADRIVAYRNPDRPGVLLCRKHGDGWGGLVPLASDDLPDGGICTYGRPSETECGRDVLITGPETGGE